MRRLFPIALAIALLVAAPGSGHAETAAAANATPLHAGSNQGAADSFQGDHLWYFFAQPGSFRLTLSLLSWTGDTALRGKIGSAIIFRPGSAKSQFKQSGTADGAVFTGTVDQPQKVFALISPPNSPPVRSARNYTLEASGEVSFGGGGPARGDPIVGTYISKRNNYGATKFLADGRVVTSSDQTGAGLCSTAPPISTTSRSAPTASRPSCCRGAA